MTAPWRADIDRALDMLRSVAVDPDQLRYVVLDGEPHSKARPRFGKGGRAFTPKESRAAEERTRNHLVLSGAEQMTGNVSLVAVFHRSNRQRIDVDNLLKHICDAANGVLWIDDSQVTSLVGIIEYDPDRPRTLLAWAPHKTTMGRGTDAVIPCQQCGNPIPIQGRTKIPKTCSRECAARLRGFEPLETPVTCKQCGKPFRRTTRAQTMCSPECRADRLRGARKAKAQPRSRCEECGKELSHTRGGRCRDCWRKSPGGSE